MDMVENEFPDLFIEDIPSLAYSLQNSTSFKLYPGQLLLSPLDQKQVVYSLQNSTSSKLYPGKILSTTLR